MAKPSEVASYFSSGGEVHQDTVDLLQRVLDRAKRGEVVGVALATATSDGGTATAFTWVTGSWDHIIAGVRRLGLRLDDFDRATD